MNGFLDLQTADDLYAKLKRDFARLQAEPTDTDAAYNFFVTGWHLLEWAHPGRAQEDLRARKRDANVELLIAEHLAVAGKHFAPKDPRLESVDGGKRSGVWSDSVWGANVWAKGTWAETLTVHLDGKARDILGDKIDVMPLAERLMNFWHQEFREVGRSRLRD
jgi:hypothetical protein